MEAEAGVVVAALVLLGVLPLLGIVLWHRRSVERWREAGAALGLAPHGEAARLGPLRDYDVLRGSVGGRAVQLVTYTTGSGKSEQRWTALEAAAERADPGFALRVTREGLGARLAKLVGGQDVEVGNPDFDARFRVQASDAERARRALGFGGQQAVAAMPAFHELRVGGEPNLAELSRAVAVLSPRLGRRLEAAQLVPGGSTARLVWQGVVKDTDRLAAALPLLAKVAEAAEEAAPRA